MNRHFCVMLLVSLGCLGCTTASSTTIRLEDASMDDAGEDVGMQRTCGQDHGGCDPLVSCDDSSGEVICGSCPSGYQGNGMSGCVDIDECSVDNGGCDPLSLCTNSAGSFECGDCPNGYSGSGEMGCVDIDECSTGDAMCDVNARCTNEPGSFTCACLPGYFGDGFHCGYAPSCQALRDSGANRNDNYTIDPDGGGPIAPFVVFCDMVTDGGGWTRCGQINEVIAGNDQCVPEVDGYLSPNDLMNYSFCKKLFDDVTPGELMLHNLTPGDATVGFDQRIFVDWSADPIVPGAYDSKSVSCHLLKEDFISRVTYPNCRYAAPRDWESAMWSFSDGVDHGYEQSFSSRVIVGPTFSACDIARQWHGFGASANMRTVDNTWHSALAIGDLYLR